MYGKSTIKPPFFSSKYLCKPKFICIYTMASILFLIFLSLLLFFTLTSATSHHHRRHLKPTPPPELHIACQATRYPDICESTLSSSNLPPNPKPIQVIQSAMMVSSQNLKTAQAMVKTILDSSLGNPNKTITAKNCLEVLGNSAYRLKSTANVLPKGRLKDGRAWMSAALQYQVGCWSGLQKVNDSQTVNETIAFMNSLVGYTSNALSLIRSYDLFGEKFALWKPPMTERAGFWEDGGVPGGSGLGFKGGFPSGLTPDVTVCKEVGKGCVMTVQAAVDKAPNNVWTRKFVIKINQGVYKETVRVLLEKKNVVFLGDGMGKTVITGSLNVGMPGISTADSATVGVIGEGFMARDITFENTAGPDAHQAVAFRSDSDLSIVESCEFLGNQDTLYPRSLRQFYKSCHIEGNVDFIFGNSASLFQDCTILIRPRQLDPAKGANNAVTAHGRTDPAQTTGFVFQNCLINGTTEYMGYYNSNPKAHKNFLGRPWKEYSRTVFIHCNLEALIIADGWMPWSGDFALQTLYYGEFENSGAGSKLSGRVTWSSQIPKEHVLVYSTNNFIQGSDWIPNSSQ